MKSEGWGAGRMVVSLLKPLVVLACLTTTMNFPAAGQPPNGGPGGPADINSTPTDADQELAIRLQHLIVARRYREALDLIEARPDLANRADAVRLRARLLALVGRESEALALLERHLAKDDRDAIARFELAELHFAANRDGPAITSYRLALAGDLDPTRQSISQARLAKIEGRRVWRVWVGASISPDSNLNGATDATHVDLFGLPFELSDDARRRSGVAVSMTGGVERRVRLSPSLRLRANLIGSVTKTGDPDFDDAYASLRVGPRWTIFRSGSVSLQASASRRWFGGDPFESNLGAIAEFDIPSLTHIRWSGAIRVELSDMELQDARDGWLYGAEVTRTKYLGPTSLWRLNGALVYRHANELSETFMQGHLGVGRLFAAPFSSLLYVEPYVRGRSYDGAAVAFGVKRVDAEYGMTARFSKRDWAILSTFPYIAVSLARNDSNIPLYDYARERVEFGFTREF
jgi:outer membrane protein